MQALDRRTFLSLAAPVAAAAQGDEEGFVSLFDGTSLRGWVVQQGPESSFYSTGGAIAVHPSASSPTWLRSEREYENFDLRGEFYVGGWTDSGIYLHAPAHGRPSWTGLHIKVFHQVDKEPQPNSMGAVFPLVAPLKINVRKQWNDFRILMDWPRLKVWTNGEIVQDLDVNSVPDLRYRLRKGYLGLVAAASHCRFRNLRIRELPPKEHWTILYERPEDMEKWFVSEGQPNFETLGPILRADGLGHIATREKFRDFALRLYIRGQGGHNGGVLFRSAGQGLKNARRYEIQLHPVEEAHFPTGSLYYLKRAAYPRIEDEKWYLFQMWVQGKSVVVRINGENVLEYDRLSDLDEGHIELQAHRRGYWIEFQQVLVKAL